MTKEELNAIRSGINDPRVSTYAYSKEFISTLLDHCDTIETEKQAWMDTAILRLDNFIAAQSELATAWEALREAIESMENMVDDLTHCLDNRCVPTKHEVFSAHAQLKEARDALAGAEPKSWG